MNAINESHVDIEDDVCRLENVSFQASVIIPTFNDSERLSSLIKSLENQTCKNFEIIVVDDGSTDDTKKVVDLLKNKSPINIRYFYLSNQNIFGAGIARNFGAKNAKNSVLIFLDQDMIAHPKLVSNHLQEQNKCDVVLGYIAGYGNKKYRYDFKKLKEMVYQNRKIRPIIDDFRKEIFDEPKKYEEKAWEYFVSANFSIKKNLFLKSQFDENIVQWGGQDIELGYRLVKKGHNPKFCKYCLSYNSSDKKMLDRSKFISSMHVLIYIANKHKKEELKKYCFERFYHTLPSLRGNSELTLLEDKLIFKEPDNYAFIRIDDVYRKDKNLSDILEFTIKHSIPVNLQIVPDLLEKDLINLLKGLKQKHPELISINQHGFGHKNNNPQKIPKYEFGPSRTLKQQKEDILKGAEILRKAFGNDFSKIFTPPYYGYDSKTLKILKYSGFNLISLKKGINYQDEDLLNLPVNLDLIKSHDSGIYFTKEEFFTKAKEESSSNQYLGIVLHPPKMRPSDFDNFKELMSFLKSQKFHFLLMEDLKKSLFSKQKSMFFIDNNYSAKIIFGTDFKKVLNHMKYLPKLCKEVTFDVMVAKELDGASLNEFRKTLLGLMTIFRSNNVKIDYEKIRLQSINCGKLLIGPKTIDMEISNKCNYSCAFCQRWEKRAPFDFLDKQKIKSLIDEAKSLHVKTIEICGYAEPCLHPDFNELMRYALSNGFRLKILTNATFLDTNFLKKLKNTIPNLKNNLRFVVNLSTIFPRKYKLIHGQNKNLLFRVLSNIKRANEHTDVILRYIITSFNYKEIIDYIEVVKKLGIEKIDFRFVFLSHPQLKEKLFLNTNQVRFLSKEIIKAKKIAEPSNIETNLDEIKNILKNKEFLIHKDAQELRPKFFKCYNIWLYEKISIDGTVYFCCGNKIPLGNVNEDCFENIYFSNKAKEIVDESKKGIDFNKEMWKGCRNCVHLTPSIVNEIDKNLREGICGYI